MNVQAATTSSVYPTVNGATDASRPKADLGDGTKGWHFDVTLHNLSGTAATYDLSAQALSENISGGLFTGSSTDWNGKGVSVSFSGSSVTVPAKGETTVGIDIKPGNEFAQSSPPTPLRAPSWTASCASPRVRTVSPTWACLSWASTDPGPSRRSSTRSFPRRCPRCFHGHLQR